MTPSADELTRTCPIGRGEYRTRSLRMEGGPPASPSILLDMFEPTKVANDPPAVVVHVGHAILPRDVEPTAWIATRTESPAAR